MCSRDCRGCQICFENALIEEFGDEWWDAVPQYGEDVICTSCREGKPAACLGKTRHWTYCDNQHKPKEVVIPVDKPGET